MSYGRGTLHNSPTTSVWLGTVGKSPRGEAARELLNDRPRGGAREPIALRNAALRQVEWREKSRGQRAVWVYEGEIEEDGRTIRGSFHLNIMPRKRGTFELKLRAAADSDPVTLRDLFRTMAQAGVLSDGMGPV